MKKKQPTIKNIANELGISFSTVSRALQDNPRIGLKTKEKVWEVAKRIEYIPNPAAFFLKNNKTLSIGILIPSLYEAFFTDVITGVEKVIEEKGYHSIIIQSRENIDKERKAVETFLKMRIDGLIVSLSAETNQYSHFQKLESYGIPVVFFDRVPHLNGFNKVICNTKFGALLAVNYFAKMNLKSIALLNGPKDLETSNDRLQGYLHGLKANKLPINEQFIKNCNLSKEDSIDKCMEILDKEIPEAIITFNDYIALFAMIACKRKGLVPNKDIKFIGFGNLDFTNYLENPPIASVEQFPEQMGISAAKLLLDCIDESSSEKSAIKEITIETELIIH